MKRAPELPHVGLHELGGRLRSLSPVSLSEGAIEALHLHYLELRRWSGRLNLIGPGAAPEILERHYAESLAALPLILPQATELLDLGSGAGFPGLILAAASELRVTLVEARERKWAFLSAVARKSSLPVRCLNARVEAPLPPGLPERIDVVTARAIKLSPDVLGALSRRLSACGQIILWVGGSLPDLPSCLEVSRVVPLPASEQRRMLELRRRGESPR